MNKLASAPSRPAKLTLSALTLHPSACESFAHDFDADDLQDDVSAQKDRASKNSVSPNLNHSNSPPCATFSATSIICTKVQNEDEHKLSVDFDNYIWVTPFTADENEPNWAKLEAGFLRWQPTFIKHWQMAIAAGRTLKSKDPVVMEAVEMLNNAHLAIACVSDPQDFKTVGEWIASVHTSRNCPTTYFHELLNPRKAAHMNLNIWPSLKEFTKALATTKALCLRLKKHAHYQDPQYLQDSRIKCYVLGDGIRPKVAAMVKTFSNFTVYSIDPMLRLQNKNKENTKEEGYNGILLRKQTSDEFDEIDPKAPLSIILAMHAHCDLDAFWKRMPFPKIAVAIPCCIRQFIIDLPPCETFIDKAMHQSCKNAVAVWEQLSQPQQQQQTQ